MGFLYIFFLDSIVRENVKSCAYAGINGLRKWSFSIGWQRRLANLGSVSIFYVPSWYDPVGRVGLSVVLEGIEPELKKAIRTNNTVLYNYAVYFNHARPSI